MRELLSNNSLFVGQLYEDKSLALCACDLIFFTTDLQTVNSLLELIYFLNNNNNHINFLPHIKFQMFGGFFKLPRPVCKHLHFNLIKMH